MTSRRFTILLLLLLAATASRGQFVEDSIWVQGGGVGSLAYNSRADVIYGGCQYTNGVFFAIDCATNTIARSYLQPWPRYLAYDSIDNKAYLTFLHNGVDSVGVIDGVTHDRIGGLGLQGATYPVWDPQNNKLYVSCGDYDRVAVINCANDSLEQLIPVYGYPLGMELNTVHHKLYVRNWDGETVSIIDLNTHQVSEPIGTDGIPECGHYSPVFDKYYVGGHGHDSLVIIDGATDSVVARAPYGPGWVGALRVADPHGLVFVGKHNEWGPDPDTMYMLDAWTGGFRNKRAIPRGPEEAYYSELTDRMYCVCWVWDSVVVFRGDGSDVVAGLRVGAGAFTLAYSPPQRRLYVGHLNSPWVFVIRDSVTGISEPQRGAAPERLPAWTHASGGVLTLSCEGEGVLVDACGRVIVRLREGENDLRGLAPGVYFVCRASGVEREASRATKVVVTR